MRHLRALYESKPACGSTDPAPELAIQPMHTDCLACLAAYQSRMTAWRAGLARSANPFRFGTRKRGGPGPR